MSPIVGVGCAQGSVGQLVEVSDTVEFAAEADRAAAALERWSAGASLRREPSRRRGDHLPLPHWNPLARLVACLVLWMP